MKIPNRENAIIAPEKLTEYLLNIEHERGGTKARLLFEFGYDADTWQRLETDIRSFHLNTQVDVVRETIYGTRYEIHAALKTPSGRSLMVRSIWQIDAGTDFPRLITLFPD
ncbi:MAG: hypothetical protein HZC40_21725 [Chloroflexi bacterium]|nr:hypothetical protein [Chloroflexota bacterium]